MNERNSPRQTAAISATALLLLGTIWADCMIARTTVTGGGMYLYSESNSRSAGCIGTKRMSDPRSRDHI